jgi:hypothetical protein
MFQIESVSRPLHNYSDGVLAGAGLRFWLIDALVLRGLVMFDYLYMSATGQAVMGKESGTENGD